MENKYYTPELEEFHVGFEFESKRGAYDGTVKTKEQFDNEKWQYDFCSEGEFPYIERALTGTNSKNGLCHIRVKYLDREDIEGSGFKQGKLPYQFFSDLLTMIKLAKDETYSISANVDDQCLFYGKIKNKSELKKLLKQLGI